MADQNNPFQVSGPFSLAPPDPNAYYQGSPQQTVSGYGGTKEALAMFADKFLAGVSKGRLAAYNHSIQQEDRARQSLMFSMQQLQNANIPDDVKQAQMGKLSQALAQMVAGAGENGDGSGKSKKSKKGSDQSGGGSSDQPEHPANHVLTAIKGIASSFLGPGAQKQSVSAKDLQALTGETFALIGDPRNNTQNQSAELEKQLGQQYNAMRASTIGGDGKPVPITMESLTGNQGFMTGAQRIMQLNGGKATPWLAGIMGEAQANSDVKRAQEDPAYKANIKEKQAQAEYYQGLGEKDRAEAEYKLTFQAKDGTLVRKTDRGYVDDQNQPIPHGDPRLSKLTPISQLISANKKASFGASGVMWERSADGAVTPMMDPRDPSRQLPSDQYTLGIIRANQQKGEFTDSKAIEIALGYDRQITQVRLNGSLSKKDKDARVKELQEARDKTLGYHVDSMEDVQGTPPPKGKAANKSGGDIDSKIDTLLKSMSQGMGEVAPPPGSSKTPRPTLDQLVP